MTLGEIFKNGLVVQGGRPFRVFGTGEGTGSVTWQGETKPICPSEGRWCVEFPPVPYGGPYQLLVTLGTEEIRLTDIMVGEVLLCSGQSNMQFHMSEESTPREDYRDDAMLRIFVSERMEAGEGITPKDGWVSAKVDNINQWSALAYLVGRELRVAGCIAVGVIACSQGASVIQSWMPKETVEGTALDLPKEELFWDHHSPLYSRWNGYGTLYDFMLFPLFPYSLGGVVWYQGESNASAAEGAIYDRFLTGMIKSWREGFRTPELPFVVVQLADLDGNNKPGWDPVREKQAETAAKLSGVCAVPCADLCESNDIHPRTKWRLAKRIASVMAAERLIPFFEN